ncbi:hypothetical protein WL51_23135 [Burkholderia ubonensis]|uniref:Fis family transcriptional regulator n=2 Tax=Burkholderia cepacia complex TaxID=87882 RepID=A0A1B4PZ33_BURCE|nr:MULTISPECIES: hypothetical protein [Burkholderia cepacia complex]AOK19211.1 hypothetical protein WT26_25010 [Burkholderia cepacia]AOK25969.1 hypothetical protein WK67_24890 [Burkholderia ubonensis]KWC49781.1 hypothetical protein WL51_23135 [Burkholderia ubonensis]
MVLPKVRRADRKPLTKSDLLPLPTAKVRALSLENHMALAAIRAGHGGEEQISCLLRVVYLAFYMRGETEAGADLSVYRQAEAALDACIARAEQGTAWLLLDREQSTIEQILVVHDEQLAAVPMHRYCAAWENLQRFMTGQIRSPIPTLNVPS